MTEDEKDFQENWNTKFSAPDKTKKSFGYLQQKLFYREGFIDGRQTLREKIKADPSIGKLEVEDWPESPDY